MRNQYLYHMRFLYALILLLLTITVQGQSGYAYTDKGKADVDPQGVSLNNPWVGATFSYNIAGEGLSENFLFSAKVLYFAYKNAKFGLPIVGTAAPFNTDLQLSSSGYNAGLYPYFIALQKENLDLVIHGGIGYKVIPGDSTALPLNQLRATAGAEIVYWGGGRSKAGTVLSVTPVFTFNDSVEDKHFLEGTLIVPIGEFLGLLVETQIPFDGSSIAYRAGVIVRKQL